ncbi:hypothetical protein AHAT_26150 [Agarivorans sp. Toyoura001]|uniref:hypothetical protein n=1 Tax=Agarivorans sp. Toyoura001 TaxID=2283141 RepID=UPI0010DEFA28|nr:hypothetical protein [Agarivorans sp. Toyoura001]GDY26725.1 hypothetical protein AHAT_26150 [Agarivorans sp. Toyoura001]
MISGTIIYGGNIQQPCFASYRLDISEVGGNSKMKVLLYETPKTNGTFINNSEYSQKSAIRAVIDKYCYDVNVSKTEFFYLRKFIPGFEKSIIIDKWVFIPPTRTRNENTFISNPLLRLKIVNENELEESNTIINQFKYWESCSISIIPNIELDDEFKHIIDFFELNSDPVDA